MERALEIKLKAQTQNYHSPYRFRSKCFARTGHGHRAEQKSVKQDLEAAKDAYAMESEGEANSAEVETLNLRIKQLEKSEEKLRHILEDYMNSDRVLRNRAKELELSQRKLFETIDQLNAKVHLVENANLRVKGKLQDMQGELRDLVQNQENAEKKQKEKLRRLQDQLKIKKDEVKSQSEYFEHFKQKQKQQAAMLRERVFYLQGHVSSLRKEVLDLNATLALLTTELEERTFQYLQRKQETTLPGTQGSLHFDMDVTKMQTLLEDAECYIKSHLQTLQQNLTMLVEREESNSREQADLLTKLQRSQDAEDFLLRKLEESCHNVYELKLSEVKLQEQIEELMEENKTLKDELGVRLQKEAGKELLPAGIENGGNAVSVNLSGDLFQDKLLNLKWETVLDPSRNKATQTSSLPQHDKESGHFWLEEVVDVYSQRISTLMQEKEDYVQKLCMLQKESNDYAQKMCALEEEIDAYSQYILAKAETNIYSSKQLPGKVDVDDKYNNILDESETFSKNLSHVHKEKDRSSVKEMPEEKLVLKKDMDRIQKETSEQLLEFQKADENLTLENKELKELISDVGISFEDLKKDKILGRKGHVQNLSQENKSIQHQMQAKEMGAMISKTHMEEKGIQIGEPSNDFTRKERGPYLEKGSAPESYSVMQELERAKEELKIQQTELEKAKKEAQKWYRELGFADTRYEEVKTDLTQALSELNQLKQANAAKMLRKQCCTLMTKHAVNETQDSKEDKIAHKRLEQQVLTLKSQLRDQAMLQTQFQDLQREVELLQAQLSEKTEELQKKKTEADLTVAPLKAKLACLVRKCHERNSLITQLARKLHRHGAMDSVLSEEAKDLVNDTVLADYLFTFTPANNQKRASQLIIVPEKTEYNQASQTSLPSEEDHDLSLCGSLISRVCTTTDNFQPSQDMPQTVPPVLLPSEADTSWVNGLLHNHGMYRAEVTEEERPPGSFHQEANDIHCFHTTQTKCTTSPLKLTSPERIVALHRELRQNHRSNYQIPPFNSFSSNLKADCSLLSHGQDVTSWDTRSKVNNTLNFSERRPFHAIKERDHLLQCDDVFQSQTGNQHAGAVPQGRKKKNAIMNNTWISREKTDGSNSATTAKSYLSDMLSASNKGRNPVGKKSDSLERVKSSEMKQGPPVPVGLVNIIKTIGESTMLLGWERPVLDELGCSNGHFITGYRICIDGKFHKFVASSACTKTILENLDLSVPFQISVQTVSSSGLVSEKKNVQFSCPSTGKEAASFASSDYPEEQKPDVSSQEVVATTCITNDGWKARQDSEGKNVSDTVEKAIPC
ncbi:golgin subfamily A member 4 [Alligator mississippiensis]|uniref:Golgin subfamily A member 4 n=1 Tax=Alligator mississippiensis TaxID=8496 RepID=A0A151P9R0_ALLMI|nr:golgin subfamily A member 4 [Alligator mississippiensis]